MFHQVEVVAFVSAVISGLFIYWQLVSRKFILETKKQVAIFFAAWSAIYLLEYYIFGASSYISIDTDGRNFAYLQYLSQRFEAGSFTFEHAGGQDISVMLPGTQAFQPERILLKFFAPWVVFLHHKMVVAALGFWGSFLLIRRVEDTSLVEAVALATLFPLSHAYLANFSLEFGTGFAAIPLAVYVAIIRVRETGGLYWVLATASILACAQPMKVFPALFVATVGAAILIGRVDLRKTILVFLTFIAAAVINWHEVLYALVTLAPSTTRVLAAGAGSATFSNTLVSVPTLFQGSMTINVLIVLSLLILALTGKDASRGPVIALIWFIGAYVIAKTFPWQVIGLALINRIEHAYMALALPLLSILIIAKALACIQKSPVAVLRLPRKIRPELVVLSVAIAMLVYSKFTNGARYLALGGQSRLSGYENLLGANWKGKKDFRTVTLFDVPHPNIIASSYHLDSFDGAVLLNPVAWNRYWYHVKKRDLIKHRVATRPEVDWRYWNGKTYDAGEHLNLDLLRAANVRYLLSALPLMDEGLSAVFEPAPEDWPKNPREMFSGLTEYLTYRWRRIFDPGKHFIYELNGALPRIYAPREIIKIDDGSDSETLHRKIAAHAPDKDLVVSRRHTALIPAVLKVKILDFNKVDSGYDINIDPGPGGLLVFNVAHGPYWTARAQDRSLQLFPVNAIQTAIVVPPGVEKLAVRYDRPTLKEILF